jgi:uncharacterized RDD family membrane protein YckC
MQYYISKNGQQTGPFTLEQIRTSAMQGSLSMSELCWAEGMATWVSVAQVLGIAPPPPMPQAKYAGFWVRFAALILDMIIIGVPLNIVGGLFIKPPAIEQFQLPPGRQPTNEELQKVITAFIDFYKSLMPLMFASFIINWLYSALMDSSAKQGTLGKMVCGLRITDLEGNRISFGKATGRFFAKSFLSGIFLIGFIMAAFTERKQGLHDMIAGTLVVTK